MVALEEEVCFEGKAGCLCLKSGSLERRVVGELTFWDNDLLERVARSDMISWIASRIVK